MRVFLGVFVQVFIARYLGPEKYGEISFITKYVGIFTNIIIFGLDELVVIELLKEKDSTKNAKLLSGIFILRMTLATIAFLMLFITLQLSPPINKSSYSLILALGIVYFLKPFLTYELLFYKESLLNISFKTRSIGSLGLSLGRVVGSLNQLSTASFIFLNFLEDFYLAVSFKILSIKHQVKFSFDSIYFKKALSLLKAATPLAFASFVMILEQRFALVLVERFCDPKDLGLFSLTLTAIDILQYIPISLGIASLPALANTYSVNMKLFKSKIQKIVDAIFFITAFLAFMHISFGKYAITTILGEQYKSLPELLNYIFLVNIFFSLNLIRVKWFSITGHLKQWLIFSSASFIVSAGLQWFLVQEKGIIGIYYAWIYSQIFCNLVGSLLLSEVRQSFISFLLSPYNLLKLSVQGLIRK